MLRGFWLKEKKSFLRVSCRELEVLFSYYLLLEISSTLILPVSDQDFRKKSSFKWWFYLEEKLKHKFISPNKSKTFIYFFLTHSSKSSSTFRNTTYLNRIKRKYTYIYMAWLVRRRMISCWWQDEDWINTQMNLSNDGINYMN